MDIATALDFIAANNNGTLASIDPKGFPHLSIVTAGVVEGHLWVSATQTRMKARHVRANPNVTFLAGMGPWAAIEGTARIDDAEGIGERLRLHYRIISGEHPDWADFDRAMIADQRLLIDVTPVRAYGMGV